MGIAYEGGVIAYHFSTCPGGCSYSAPVPPTQSTPLAQSLGVGARSAAAFQAGFGDPLGFATEAPFRCSAKRGYFARPGFSRSFPLEKRAPSEGAALRAIKNRTEGVYFARFRDRWVGGVGVRGAGGHRRGRPVRRHGFYLCCRRFCFMGGEHLGVTRRKDA